MSKRNYRLFIGIVFTCMLGSCAFKDKPLQVQKGILDLRNSDLDEKSLFHLDGTWKFYPSRFLASDSAVPHTFLKVPGVWNEVFPESSFLAKGDGYGTYSLKILLPPDAPPLALQYMTVSTAMEMWIDGKKVANSGKPGITSETSEPDFRTGQVSFSSVSDTVNVMVYISNFHYIKGGLWESFVFGSETAVSDLRFKDGIKDFFLIGGLLLISLYFITLYFVVRFIEAPLFFGLVSLLMLIRILFTDHYFFNTFISLPFDWIVRIEFLSFYLCVPAFTLFSERLFPDEIIPKTTRFIYFINAGFFLLVLFLPVKFISYTAIPFQIFLIIYLIYGFYCYIQAVRHRREGSTLFLAGFVIMFLVVLNDILYSNNVIDTGNLFFAGTFVFIFALAVAISKIFVSAFIRLEESHSELTEKNEEIEGKNEQLTQLNAELDAFVYRTSHDLRGPITSLLGLIELGKYSTDLEEIKSFGKMGIKSLKKMDKILNDIITFSKNIHLDLFPEKVDFTPIIEEIWEGYAFSEQNKLVEKTYNIQQECTFFSDKTRLSYILNNLISNSLQYSDFNKPNPSLHINIQINENRAVIEYQDNGVGIGEESINKVFDMFYRGSELSTGAGLGLYIVRETVKKLNGNITISSEIGSGTLVKVQIPNLSYKINLDRKKKPQNMLNPI